MDNITTLALFGEAEKGDFHTPYHFNCLPQVMDVLGHPPPQSSGLFYAVQALMFNHELIFFRVEEEGFSYQDYFKGLRILEKDALVSQIAAICLPGVGDSEILDATIPLCEKHHSLYIMSEQDLYDYLTRGV